MEYKSTAVKWGSFMRELFMEHVKIDESLCWRKIKYNRGNPSGQKIWIFVIVERRSNTLVMYPVDSRDADTLISLIKKHVEPGTRIFSDNWAAYFKLNDLGHPHFTVTHKTTFKQAYKNVDPGELVYCNTKRTEGAWKISKDHFRRINDMNMKLLKQHLCEVIWRNHCHKDNLYDRSFTLLKSVYTLESVLHYKHPVPLFPTWTSPIAADEEAHHYTIIQQPDGNSSSDEELLSSAVASENDVSLVQLGPEDT